MTIHRYLNKSIKNNQFTTSGSVNLSMVTTYFGRKYGVKILFDIYTIHTLSIDEVAYQTNALYFKAMNKLKAKV